VKSPPGANGIGRGYFPGRIIIRERIFLDSDVLVHAFNTSDADRRKHEKAALLFNSFRGNPDWKVSTRILEETCDAVIHGMSPSTPDDRLAEFIGSIPAKQIEAVDPDTIHKALVIRDRYMLSFRDSLVIASALKGKCTILYSEDMCNGQTVDKLRIVNPFR